MKKLIEFFATKGIFADLLTVGVILIGILAVFILKREVFPNIEFDTITISTIYPGASPEEVEKLITNKIEQELQEVDGIKKITSVSAEGRSYVVIQLDSDQTNLNDAKSDIQDAIDRMTNLPDNSEKPAVISLESKQTPIIEVSLSSEVSEMELRDSAKKLEKELEKLPGVARVTSAGMRDLEIHVEASLEKLSQYRLSLDDLIQALDLQNRSIPGGIIEATPQSSGKKEILIRTVGELQTSKDVEEVVIRANDIGRAIRIRDVATVELTLKKATQITRTNARPSINLTIIKKENMDAIKLVDSIKEFMDKKEKYFNSKDVHFDYVNDSSFYIRRRLNVLTSNLLIGLILVLGLLSIFMPFRVAVIVSIGIPFAFLGTLIFFVFANIGISLLTVLGLIIVAGMIVDDAIVVVDNAVRLMEEGLPPKEASIKATQQIWRAVTASVLTTIFAFLPLMLMSGIMGKFVSYIPIGVIVGLFVSLLECFFVLPHHIQKWISIQTVPSNKIKRNFFEALRLRIDNAWKNNFVPTYIKALKKTVHHRYLSTLVIFLLLVMTGIVAKFGMKFMLFPKTGIEIFFIRADAPVGTTLNEVIEYFKPAEEILAKLPPEELQHFVTLAGIQQQDAGDPNAKRGNEYGQIVVYLTPETDRNRTATEIMNSVRDAIGKLPGFVNTTYEFVNPGPPQGKPISIGVRGENYDEILPAVETLKGFLKKISGASDITDTHLQGKEEIQVYVNTNEAAAAGLTVTQVGNTVRAAYEGIEATTITKLDEEVKIRVMLTQNERANSENLTKIHIRNPQGNLVPLGYIAKFKKAQGYAAYQHEHNERQVRVTGEVDTNITTSTEINKIVRKQQDEILKGHPNVNLYFGGEDEDTRESMESLIRAFVIAAFLIFLTLVLLFNNLFQPLLILLTIPLGLIAVVWAFFLHGMPLSFLGLFGVVALAGIIVNNAIVLVSFINELREAGADRFQSIIDASQMRIRPIFLTTATTAFGILPTAYGIGGLDPFVVPLAMALGWGILFGSVLTTLFFPAAVAILDDFLDFITRRKQLKENT